MILCWKRVWGSQQAYVNEANNIVVSSGKTDFPSSKAKGWSSRVGVHCCPVRTDIVLEDELLTIATGRSRFRMDQNHCHILTWNIHCIHLRAFIFYSCFVKRTHKKISTGNLLLMMVTGTRISITKQYDHKVWHAPNSEHEDINVPIY